MRSSDFSRLLDVVQQDTFHIHTTWLTLTITHFTMLCPHCITQLFLIVPHYHAPLCFAANSGASTILPSNRVNLCVNLSLSFVPNWKSNWGCCLSLQIFCFVFPNITVGIDVETNYQSTSSSRNILRSYNISPDKSRFISLRVIRIIFLGSCSFCSLHIWMVPLNFSKSQFYNLYNYLFFFVKQKLKLYLILILNLTDQHNKNWVNKNLLDAFSTFSRPPSFIW